MITILGLPIILLFSITLHEYAHGWTAYKLGDYTPKACGRLSYNPFIHIDAWGTIILPILLFLLTKGLFCFAYAKPIPINSYHLHRPRRDTALMELAGPLASAVIAILFLLILRWTPSSLQTLIIWGVFFNTTLAVFNLIPIPPFDGAKIITAFLPYQTSYNYLKFAGKTWIFILILIAGLFLKPYTAFIHDLAISFL